MEERFTITNKTKSTLPCVPFAVIKNKILGEKYELSLVFVGEVASRKLNLQYRQKDKSTNILSFPLDKKTGEIFITPAVARHEMKKFDKTFEKFLAFLFIHGCLHLKGMEHGSTMDKAEQKWLEILQLE